MPVARVAVLVLLVACSGGGKPSPGEPARPSEDRIDGSATGEPLGEMSTVPDARDTGVESQDGSANDGRSQPPAAPSFGPVEDLAAIERITPDEWVLFALSYDRPTEPSGVHVDDDGVYWVQKGGTIFRGEKDGSGTPSELGRFRTSAGQAMVSDDEHLYWVTLDELRRVPRRGGEVEEVALGVEHLDAALAVDDRFVYSALPGCRQISRVDKASLRVETMDVHDDAQSAGEIALAVEGSELFCGAWGSIFVVSEWGREPARLVSDADRISAIAVLPDHVYWIDRNDQQGPLWLGRVARAGGTPELFVSDQELLYWGNRGMVYAPDQQRLFFIWDSYIAAYALETGRYEIYARDTPLGYLAIDAQYLYYTSLTPRSVKRMPLGQPARYSFQ